MLRSMYSAVSGLRGHQTMLDVVGNNIANVNTTGFKASSVTFQEALTQVQRGAGVPTDENGGTNPMAVGLGSQVVGITADFTQGGSQSTGKQTDMAIQGDGMFMVDTGTDQLYTRAGGFTFDGNGTLVTADGHRLQGWAADPDGTIDTAGDVGAIDIPLAELMPARATETVRFGGNLSADTAIGETRSSSIEVYDSLGNTHELVIEFTRTSASDWDVEATIDGTAYTLTPDAVQFDTDGNLISAPQLDFSGFTPAGADPLNFEIDFESAGAPLVQYGGPNSAEARRQDGEGIGELRDLSVGADGTLTARFSNGGMRTLGAIAIASFGNYEGLEVLGGGLYAPTGNSGNPQLGLAGTADRGTIQPGALEMSNVDLAKEFTQMIMAQRGFQANARVITTSDEVLTELTNMKR